MSRKRLIKNTQSRLRPKVKLVSSKTENQKNYIHGIVDNDIIFCSGPAGSGKSFIAAGMASQYLYQDDIEKIIITRPLVCTGKDIGSLPGELQEKINPYLVPMRENLKYFLGLMYYNEFYQQGQICFEPLEMMRGMTFHNCCMILDEAQNCTFEQIKMFITRMGKNSKVIINGDINQTDLTRGRSGLENCINKLREVEGIAVCELNHDDIQRNDLIAKVLRALET
jgi:phosphate starvation-inducible PhoH-like protein